MIMLITGAVSAIPEFIGAIIQSITTIVIFFLAFRKDRYFKNTDTLHKRLDKLYFPFYQKFMVGNFSNEHKLSSCALETRAVFLDLFSQNLHYMGSKSQLIYIEFYTAFLHLLEAYDGNKDFPLDKISNSFDKAFTDISKSLLSEYNHICRQLKLPKPIKLL